MNQAKRRIVLAVTIAEHGGVQAFLLRFAKYLQTEGHAVTVLAGEGSWLFEMCAEAGIATRRLTHMRRALHPWHDVCAFFELIRVFAELKPDAIHLNSSKMGVIGSLAGRWSHVTRIVYRIGGWTFLEPLSPLTCWLYRTAERVSASWKDVIICVHPGDEAIAQSLHITPHDSLLTIPNGIDLGRLEASLVSQQEARRVLALETDSFVFGTIANLFPAKDLPRYLETCAIVHKEHPEAQFMIVGEGMERAMIEKKRRELGLESAVHLPGAITNASSLLRGFDAFVLPSAKEGMSWALLEAMAAGLPCLATDVGANAWLLDGAGWIVPVQDPQALARAMVEVLKHPTDAKMRGVAARERVAEDFPLEKTLRRNVETLL